MSLSHTAPGWYLLREGEQKEIEKKYASGSPETYPIVKEILERLVEGRKFNINMLTSYVLGEA